MLCALPPFTNRPGAGEYAAVGTLLVVTLASGGPGRAAAPCTPVARVSGQAAMVPAVHSLLTKHGIAVTGASTCGAVIVTIAGDGGSGRITITDVDGRRVERPVEDAAGAATLIETWTRRDLSEPLLAALESVHPTTAATPPVVVAAAQKAPAPVAARRIELGAAGEGGWSGDGELWMGLGAHGCVDVGAWCFGALVRYAVDAAGETNVSRSALDTLLMADRPFAHGRFTLSPGAAIGETSIKSVRTTAGLEDDERTVGLHLRAHLGASYRLIDAWSIGLDLAGAYSPFVATKYGDPGDRQPPLPGAPRFGMSLGLGVSYGGL